MAEMASMAPTSAGQYHWVSEFAPPSAQKFLSYISGWLSALGWQANIAVTSYVSANLILASAGFYNGYVVSEWHQTLFMIGLCLLAISFNAFAAKHLPLLEGVLLFFLVIGFFAVMIPLWVLAPKVSAREVFTTFENFGEWPTIGTACIVGVLASAGAFIGADSAVHLSEEVKNASVTVPRVMFFTVLLNGAFGFVSITTYVSCIQSVEKQIAGSTAAFPFMEVFEVATGSKAGAISMTVPFIVIAFSMCLNSVAAGSRQGWAFARDEGFPFSVWLSRIRVVRGTPLPINAMICTMFIAIVLALINLGGGAAFNSIAGLISGAIGLTYALSIGCVLWRRLFGAPLPHARWSLGWLGLPFNFVGFFFELFVTVMSFFPLPAHVTVYVILSQACRSSS
ncbi:hypothetical protein LTR37_007321 [Vermiconidia calcicola]|uniref:Uncharacterized protein n=1 Tax=Vermiconidia calcicola TaxID=1690605 RepID=A0ACC3NDM0_9PEZI|nr:hypothetical protein LTR37_007321 [Vermiconidia calcicola]